MPNSTQTVTAKILELGCLPTCVAQAKDSIKYPKKKRYTKEIELDVDGTPKPKFTGKNPSWDDVEGNPTAIMHGRYYSTPPTEDEMTLWAANPDNGIGMLCTESLVWIDFDVKDFKSKDDCDKQFNEWLDKYPVLKGAWTESTGSGGYHVLVKLREPKVNFTLFSLSEGGSKCGDALGQGRYCVLAPTKGTAKGQYKDYETLRNFGVVIEVESLDSIGIYSYSSSKAKSTTKAKVTTTTETKRVFTPINATLDLKDLGSSNSLNILEGFMDGDRSELLTVMLSEFTGWENWLTDNGITYTGTARDLGISAGALIGVDEDRIDRIIATIDTDHCIPASSYLGGDKSCWAKVRKLNDRIYTAYCPQEFKSEFSGEALNNRLPYVRSSEVMEDLEEFDPESIRANIAKIKGSKNVWSLIKKSFPRKIVEVIDHYTLHLGIPSELYALSFLTAISGSLNAKYRVLVNESTTWFESLNIFFVIVGDPGTNKSSITGLVTQYHDRQNEIYAQNFREESKTYKRELAAFKAANKSGAASENGEEEPEEPTLRYASIGKSTMANLIMTQGNQKNQYKIGLLQAVDELASILDGTNKYDGGSDDISDYLSMFSGKRVTSSTKGGGCVGTFGMISMLATTQPITWKRLMSKHSEGNGYDDRFLVGELLHGDMKSFDHGCNTPPPHDMSELVGGYVRTFDALPVDRVIPIKSGITKLLNSVERWFDENPSCRAKPKSYIFRLAGIFACLRDASNPEIIASDIESAWRLVSYSEACLQSINGGGETLGSELVTKALAIYNKCGECSYTELKKRSSTFRGLCKIELTAIIEKVSEVVTDGEWVTTCKGTRKLVRKGVRHVALTEVIAPEVTPTVVVAPVVKEPKVEALEVKVDNTPPVAVECSNTVEVEKDRIPTKYHDNLTANNIYNVLSQTDSSYMIQIPGISKPIRIAKK